jgi:surface antigen
MILEIVLASLISTAKIEKKYDTNNSKLANYISRGYLDNNDTRHFVLADSLQQREEAAQRLANATLYQRSQRPYSSNVGGQSEIIGDWNVPNGCVPYAWSQGMQTRGYQIARNYPVQSEPTGFVSTYEGRLGHVAVVEQDLGDRLVIRDANYKPGKVTRRIISKSLVKGYVI